MYLGGHQIGLPFGWAGAVWSTLYHVGTGNDIGTAYPALRNKILQISGTSFQSMLPTCWSCIKL